MVTEVVSVMMWNASIQLRRCQVKTVNIYLKRLCAQGFTVKSACYFWPWNVPLHWVGVTPLTLVGGEVSVGVILEAIRASFKHLFKVGIQWLSRALLCDPTDSSMPGFPALLYLQEFVQLMPAELMMPSNHLFLFCPLLLQPSIFPRIRVFFNELALPISWQSIGASASAWVLPKNIQGWLPLGLTGLISLQFLTAYSSLQLCSLQLLSRNSQVFSSTTVLKPIISLKNLLFLSNSKPFLQVFIPHHEHWTRLLFSHCAKHILLG